MRPTKAHPRFNWLGVACFLTLGCARSDSLSGPAAARLQPTLSRDYTYSEHFYPVEDNKYYWDGTVPPDDAAPAEILEAVAGGSAPAPNKTGWVSAKLKVIADQYKVDLTFSVTKNGRPFYSNASASSDWKWVPGPYTRDPTPIYWDKTLSSIMPECGYALTNGGTAYARKVVPFGISISFIQPSISFELGTISWGGSNAPLQAFVDAGVACRNPCPASANDPIDGPASCDPNGSPPSPDEGAAEVDQYPTDQYTWSYDLPDTSGPSVMCERIMYYYRYSDGSTSDPWYAWQCEDGATYIE